MKLEQRNFELERKLSSNQGQNPGVAGNTSSKDNSFNDSFTNYNNNTNNTNPNTNDDSLTSSTKNTDCSVIKTTTTTTNTTTTQPAALLGPANASILLNTNSNPQQSCSPTSKFQQTLNAIPNINQGGFIITSNGSIAYVPPMSSTQPQQRLLANGAAEPSSSSLASSSNDLSPNGGGSSSKQTYQNTDMLYDEQLKLDFESLTSSAMLQQQKNSTSLDLSSFLTKNLFNPTPKNGQTSPKPAKIMGSPNNTNKSAFILSANGQILPVLPANSSGGASVSPGHQVILPVPILPKQQQIQPKLLPATSLLKPAVSSTSNTANSTNTSKKASASVAKTPRPPKKPANAVKSKTNLKKSLTSAAILPHKPSESLQIDLTSLLVPVSSSNSMQDSATPAVSVATSTPLATLAAKPASGSTNSNSTPCVLANGKKPREIRPKPSSSSNLLNIVSFNSSNNILIKPATTSANNTASQNQQNQQQQQHQHTIAINSSLASKLNFSLAPIKLNDLNNNMGTLNLVTSNQTTTSNNNATSNTNSTSNTTNTNNNLNSFSIESNDILAKAASMIFSPNEFSQLNSISPCNAVTVSNGE